MDWVVAMGTAETKRWSETVLEKRRVWGRGRNQARRRKEMGEGWWDVKVEGSEQKNEGGGKRGERQGEKKRNPLESVFGIQHKEWPCWRIPELRPAMLMAHVHWSTQTRTITVPESRLNTHSEEFTRQNIIFKSVTIVYKTIPFCSITCFTGWPCPIISTARLGLYDILQCLESW